MDHSLYFNAFFIRRRLWTIGSVVHKRITIVAKWPVSYGGGSMKFALSRRGGALQAPRRALHAKRHSHRRCDAVLLDFGLTRPLHRTIGGIVLVKHLANVAIGTQRGRLWLGDEITEEKKL